MKTKTFWQMAMALVLGILLAACGGGTTNNYYTNPALNNHSSSFHNHSSHGTAIPPVSASPKTRINITTASGLVEILPAYADGRIAGLVVSNPTELVLDSSGKVIAGYRIAWNDNGRWYPAANIAVPLTLPKTSITGAAQPSGFGAGMPYLIRPNGDPISWNTTTCEVFVNGVQVMPSSDGLFHY